MKIGIDEQSVIKLTEVYEPVRLMTNEGNEISVCARDDTFEINVCPNGSNTNNRWRINMKNGNIESLKYRDIIVDKERLKEIRDFVANAEEQAMNVLDGEENLSAADIAEEMGNSCGQQKGLIAELEKYI